VVVLTVVLADVVVEVEVVEEAEEAEVEVAGVVDFLSIEHIN